jgi:hypothetical protein
MRNEDLDKKVINGIEKDYWQMVDRIKRRIQTRINNTKFCRNTAKNSVTLVGIIDTILGKYIQLGLVRKYDRIIVLEENGPYSGAVWIHVPRYITFSSHGFTITRRNKIFSWD